MDFLRGNTQAPARRRADADGADQRRRQGRGGHRRRRHRHRLRGHGHPPGRPERHPARDPAPAARRARAPDNPWPQWPKVYKLDYGQEEAAALWGEDPRRYSTTTRRFIGRNERVAGLEIADVDWQPGPDGRVAHARGPGHRAQMIPADLVLLALGFTGPGAGRCRRRFGCELDERGNVRTDDDKMTSVPGVFAAGDCVRGQSLVVWAIREGRAAAEGVDRYLSRGSRVQR